MSTESSRSRLSGDVMPHGQHSGSVNDLENYGSGTARSRQIFRANSSLISECLGTVEVRPAVRFTKIE